MAAAKKRVSSLEPGGPYRRQNEILSALLSKEELPHAFLFECQSVANVVPFVRQFMMGMLCDSRTSPCGACAQCSAVQEDRHPDLLNISEFTEQEIPVETARDVIRFTRMSAVQGRYKVGLIFYAERLNMAAANALLKTLEEPPSGSLLVLVAQVRHTLQHTVLSRCFRLRFGEVETGNPYVTHSSSEAAEKIRTVLGATLGEQLRFAAALTAEMKERATAEAAPVSVQLLAYSRVFETMLRQHLITFQTSPHLSKATALTMMQGVPRLRYALEHNVNAQLALEYFFISSHT